MAKSLKSKKGQKQVSSKETKKPTVEKRKANTQDLLLELTRAAHARAAKNKRYYERKGRTELAERFKQEEKKYGAVLASLEKSVDPISVDAGVTYEQKVKELEEREASIAERERYLQKKYDELKEREKAVSEGRVLPTKEETNEEEPKATDAAKKLAEKEGVDLTQVKPTGAEGSVTVDSVREHLEKDQK